MKTKMSFFIFLMAFIITAVHCGTDAKEIPVNARPPSISPTVLAGDYRSANAAIALTLHVNQTFSLSRINSHGGIERINGTYRINDLQIIELSTIIEGTMRFMAERNLNNQIVRLVEPLHRQTVLHRVIDDDDDENQVEGPLIDSSDSEEDFIVPPLNAQQRELIHQGLLGSYRGPFDHQQALLEIRDRHTLYLTRNGVERSYPYTISWENTINNSPLLIFTIEGVAHQYQYYLSIPMREELEQLPRLTILRFFRLPIGLDEMFERINDHDNEIHTHDEH